MLLKQIGWALSWMLIASAAISQAAPPVFSLLPFRKVEADSTKQYTLGKEQGPWVIVAMSFSGEDAETQARKLALELRKDHQLLAYAHQQATELETNVTGIGVDKYGNPRKMKFAQGGKLEEWAVVVGNYKSFDDPDAERVLEKLRTLQLKSLGAAPTPKKNELVTVSMVRDYYKKITKNEAKKQRGPMGKAFISRNPLAPQEEVAKGSLDAFVKELNQGVEHSLLNNRHKYTVQIATFRGVAAFNEREFNDTMRNNNMPKIDEAAIKATKVVNQLRKQGVEAYVFHDRFESLVTVGGFDQLGTQGTNGRTELPPDVAAIIKRYQAQRQAIPGSEQLALVPQSIGDIPIDVSPQLIQVPRENLADIYSRR